MKFLQTCTFIMLLLKLKQYNVCYSKMEGFIVGGENAHIHKFPHAVYLDFATNRKWICGSAVLTQDILLTAAHCLYPCVLSTCIINAYAGHESLYKVKILREVRHFKIHEKYDDVDMQHDIALARVTKSFPLRNNIKRILLANKFPKVINAQMAGWGVIDDQTKDAPVTLKMTMQVLLKEDECEQYVDMNAGVFCAATPTKVGRPSEGDSGSALVTGAFAQIGVVSFRMEDNPSILYYTNVTYYYTWIKEASQALFCDNSDSKFYS